MNKNYVEIEKDLFMCYYEQGEGKTILMIPGWTFSATNFEKQIKYFSNKYHVIAIDPRSQGSSTKTLEGNDYKIHAKDLATLIDKLNLSEIILLGWSAGSITAWNFIEEYGISNIKKLITIDMSPIPLSSNQDDWTEGNIEEIADAYNNALSTKLGHENFIEEYAKEVMFINPPSKNKLNKIIKTSLETETQVAKELFASLMFSNSMKGAKEANDKIPSLIFVAKHWQDKAIPYIKKHLPNYKVEVLGGHLMFDEFDTAFNKKVEAFIKEK